MSETPIIFTELNDFVFCPISIYFHHLESETNTLLFQDAAQINGTAAHEKCDTGAYSTKRNMLQGLSVYCEKYNLTGKIDTFDIEKGILTERKKHISTIYDGYVFQLYAEYFALVEEGYELKEIRLYSIDDNKVFSQPFPEENPVMLQKFESTIVEMRNFKVEDFVQENSLKCARCIYEPLCCYSKQKVNNNDNSK